MDGRRVEYGTRRWVVGVAIAAAIAAGIPAAGCANAPGGRAASAKVAGGSLADLPLTVVRPSEPGSPLLAILLTGDGGWAAIDKEIADSLARHGIAVVALDCRAYLASKRAPERAAADLSRIVRFYSDSLGRHELVLVGYSRGADVLPFMATRLPPDMLSEVRLIALLGLAPNANFQFHLIDLVSNHHRKDDLPTAPEVARLSGHRILCFYGVEEEEAACRSLPDSLVTAVAMPGGHHFGERYGEIADRILDQLANPGVTSPP